MAWAPDLFEPKANFINAVVGCFVTRRELPAEGGTREDVLPAVAASIAVEHGGASGQPLNDIYELFPAQACPSGSRTCRLEVVRRIFLNHDVTPLTRGVCW